MQDRCHVAIRHTPTAVVIQEAMTLRAYDREVERGTEHASLVS